jgi:4-hydroxymandelate oxidase
LAGGEVTRLDLDEWERDALAKLPPMVADYYAGGARDEETLRGNRAAWSRWALVHRVLAGVERVDPSVELAGTRLAMPIVAAPTAFHRLAPPDGELATARGVRDAGTAMVLSTLSNTPIEDVARAAPGRVLYQLYVYRDRGATAEIVARARDAGCKGLVLTADASVLGTRWRDVRNRFRLPDGLGIPNAAPSGRLLAGDALGSGLARYVAEQLDPSLGWKDLEWLRSIAGMPVWLKGVVRGDDAGRAVEAGADGVIVSNHGGRQLDGGVPTALALPEVVDAVAGRVPVWVDGGIRRGVDVLRALALGASAVLVGRPVLWGLAVGGADGVRDVLELLRAELVEAMTLLGVGSAEDVDRSYVR